MGGTRVKPEKRERRPRERVKEVLRNVVGVAGYVYHEGGKEGRERGYTVDYWSQVSGKDGARNSTKCISFENGIKLSNIFYANFKMKLNYKQFVCVCPVMSA